MTFRQKLLGLAGTVAVGAAYYYNAAVVNATVMGVVAKVAGVFAGMSFGAMAGFAVAGLVGFGLYKLVKAANGIADSFKQGLEDAGVQLDCEDASMAHGLRVQEVALNAQRTQLKTIGLQAATAVAEKRRPIIDKAEEKQELKKITLRLVAKQRWRKK